MDAKTSGIIRVKRVIQSVKEETTIVNKSLNVESLRNVVCCLCFGTKPDAARVSAFSPFADRTFLSDIIRTCFGVDIGEDHFCTDVCEQCLVRIDITWKYYGQVNANAKALNDLYRSMANKEVRSDICKSRGNNKITKSKEESGIRRNIPRSESRTPTIPAVSTARKEKGHSTLSPVVSTEQESSDSDDESESDSLSEHPFFAEHTASVYNCHLCPQTFDKSHALHVHQLNAHRSGNDNKILCHLCAKWFSQRQFNDHVRSIHQDEKCICTICGQSYSAQSNLARHMRIHTKERPYVCKQCPYTCNQSTALKQHVLRVHMGVKPPPRPKKPRKPRVPTYACKMCDSTFHHALSLNKHVSRVHMGIKPLPKSQSSDKKRASRQKSCPVCDEPFAFQSKMLTHLEESHPEHKANIIQCANCPERFLTKQGHYKHRLYRHSEKTHKCDHCGEALPSAPLLYKHRQQCYQTELQATGSQSRT